MLNWADRREEIVAIYLLVAANQGVRIFNYTVPIFLIYVQLRWQPWFPLYSRSGSFTVNARFAIFTMYNILINCVSLDREGLLHVHWKPIINYKKNSVASHTNSYNFRNTYVILNSNIILCTNLGLNFEVI